MDRKKNASSDNADEWDEADEPSGQAFWDRQDESPTPSQEEYEDEIATAVFPDLPDIGRKDRILPHPAAEDKDMSDDEGPVPDQIPDFPDLEGIPKFTEGAARVRGVDGQARSTRGDENVVETEGIFSDEERIPEDFFYDYADLVSKPKVEVKSQLPSTLLTLSHSFGYDCTRRANLHVLDNDVVTFIAGNYVVILNVKTKKQLYIRSTGGRGIGAITVHPSKKYIAIGEMGDRPDLNIFEYPSLKLYRILRAGAERAYAFLDFSPNGNLLASMGAEPDYMLTLWNWKQEKIVLRCKAFSQDVFRAMFSTELPGQLTSSGIGHIRFWKMARTFTGLKLQGSLGRFGKKEISDIEGYVELPDGKVLSGCESGNMLLWDDGLCINEISRKGKKPCHQGPIQQIIMDEGELITVGIDGYVRVWDFETTGSMQAEDDGHAMELEPVNELRVGNDVQLTSMVRSCGARELSLWYAQDASGGIWKLDLSFQFTSLQPEQFMYYHSGPIFSCGASPVSQLVATVGDDCTVRVYDFMARRLLCVTKFNSPATAFLWLPRKLDPEGATMFAGFDDGVLRLLCWQKDLMAEVRKHDFQYELRLVFALKPHNSTITCIDMDRKSELLVTGSSDGTVFFFDVLTDYAPIGFVKVSSSVNHIAWSPDDFSLTTVLVSCADGKVFEAEVPVPSICDTTTSYHLKLLKIRAFVFKSIKSRLRHDEQMARLAEEEKERKRLAQEEKQKLIDKGLWDPDDDAEEEVEDKAQKEKEKDKWEPVYPDKPSPVLCAVYGTQEGQFWVSMGAFDAGYFYECQFSVTTVEDGVTDGATAESVDRPIRAIPVADSNDVPISHIIFSKKTKYAMMGMQDGHIRIQLLLEEGNFATLSNYWMLGVHDANYGEITHLCLSYDERFLFSTGLDGNFFAFHFETRMPSELMIAASVPPDRRLESKQDIEDIKALSIEDAKQKSEHEKMLMLAEKKKEAIRQTVERMKEHFQELHKRNNSLSSYLKLNKKEFAMDPEFAKEIERQKEEKVSILNKEMAWNEEKLKVSLDKLQLRFKANCESEKTYLRAFTTPHVLANFRLGRRSRYLKECLESLRKNREEMLQREHNKMLFTKPSALGVERSDTDDLSQPLKITTVMKGSMGERLMKDLAHVEEKKRARAARQAQWKEFLESRLPDDYEDPSDLAAIQDAKSHMGDFKLKSASDYVVAQRVNTKLTTEKVIMHKLYIYEYKHNFNVRFMALRNKKMRIINRIRMYSSQLQRIHQQIPRRQAKAGPTAPNPHPEEFPEKRYEYTKASLQQWHEAYLARQAAEEAAAGASPTISAAAVPIPHNIQPMMPAMNLGGQDQMGDLFAAGAGRRGGGGGGGGGSAIDISKQELSEIEKLMKKDDEIRLIFDQEVIIRNMNDMIRNFDAELRSLRHDKFLLDISMKNAQAREIVLLHELMLLKELEKEEDVLAAIVDARVVESNETRAKIEEMQNKTEMRRKEIEYLQGQEKALLLAFHNTVGDNKFVPFLTKVFKKKIKRSHKKLLDGNESENDSDSDSDDDVSEMSDSEDDDDEDEEFHMDLDICPVGCDKALYEATCSLREDRLDIEEAMANERKARDQLIKELEIAVKSAKKTEAALDIAEKDLEDFQLTKQKGLNAIDVTCTFKLHQLEYLRKDGSLIMDFHHALAFEDFNLIHLQKRIKELQREKQRQKRAKIESRLLHISLTRDRRLLDKHIESMKETCDQMMVNKFGRLVSLEKLETVIVNRELEELRQQLHDHQLSSEMELFRWQNRLSLRQCKQREFLKHNTVLNEHLVKLTTDEARLEHTLTNRQRNVGMEQMDDFTKEELERQQLKELVSTQVDEMNEIKEEIWALSRKDGTVFPPNYTFQRY